MSKFNYFTFTDFLAWRTILSNESQVQIFCQNYLKILKFHKKSRVVFLYFNFWPLNIPFSFFFNRGGGSYYFLCIYAYLFLYISIYLFMFIYFYTYVSIYIYIYLFLYISIYLFWGSSVQNFHWFHLGNFCNVFILLQKNINRLRCPCLTPPPLSSLFFIE